MYDFFSFKQITNFQNKMNVTKIVVNIKKNGILNVIYCVGKETVY